MSLTIGVDVGGTKVAAGVVDPDAVIRQALERPTPSTSADDTAEVIAALVAELRSAYDVEAVGIGAAGFVDESRAVVRFAPNLAWREEPLQAEVARRTGLPVVVENDANATAWAEARFGAGRGEEDLVAVTVGTGIGGGMVLGGRLYRGRYGVGAEFGHVRVVPNGRPCGCGNQGCWEQYASGRALVRAAEELAATSPELARGLLSIRERQGGGITGRSVTAAAIAGDAGAVSCFTTVGRWLGQGLADLAAVLDPGLFVIGGGVSAAGELLLGPARSAYAAALTGRGHRPLAAIRPAELGPQAGLVGAADLARNPC